VGVVWGTIGPAVHLVHEHSSLSVLAIGAYRSLAAVAVLVLAARVTHRLPGCLSLARLHGRRVLLVGVSTATFQLLFFVAVVQAGVSVATVVGLGSAPVLLLLVGTARSRRPPSVGDVLTVAVATLGLALVSLLGEAGERPSHAAIGVLAALGSGAAYAVSADAGAPLSRGNDALTVTTVTMSVAAAVLAPCGLVAGLVGGGAAWTTDALSWSLVAYLGVVTMAFAYALLFAGMRSTPSGAVVVATLLEPVTAVLIAVLFLGEALTLAGVVGSLLIVAAIVSLGRRAEGSPQTQ
jgi:DME family drug/metabolite transporter